MDDSQLESLAIKEIIEELERKKQAELASRQPQERKIRPNSRFLGRTIVSVLQHNRRQNAEERRNSSRKLRELNTSNRRRPRSRSKSRSREPRRIREKPSEYRHDTDHFDYYPKVIDTTPCGIHLDLATIFLNNFNNLLSNKTREAPKKQKKEKRKSKLLTIDLTKKKKKNKRSKKSHKKSTNSKKRGQIKRNSCRKRRSSSSSSSSLSSSSSSNRSLSTICDSNSQISSDDERGSSTLLIDLT